MITRIIGIKSVVLLQTFVERLALFVLPLYMYKLTESKQMLGVIVMLEWLPTILLLPFAGRLVDKFGCRSCFVNTSIFRFLICFLFVFLAGKNPGVYMLLLFATLASAANIVAYLSFEKYVASQIEKNDVSNYYSFFSMSQQINYIISPMIGVLIVAAFSVQEFFMLYALLFFIIAFLFSMVIPRDKSIEYKLESGVSFSTLVGGLLLNRPLLNLALCMLLVNISLSVLITLIPDVIIGDFHFNERYVAYLFAASAVISGLLHMAYSYPALAKKMNLLGKMSTLLIPALLMTQVISSSSFFFMASILTIAVSLPFSVWVRTLRNSLLPKEGFATSASIVMTVSLLGYPLGGLIVVSFPMLANQWIMFGAGTAVFFMVLVLRRYSSIYSVESSFQQ